MSVFNGRDWKTYGPLDGPLGSRVFAMTTSPKDGDVWVSTEAGLARYSLTKNIWSYYTRAEGLPSDQSQALAFDRYGNLFVGTDCDGIAVGSTANDFKTWRVIPGPTVVPTHEQGLGLPSALINSLLVSHDGTIYAGTTTGLASSYDDGRTWVYLRGADWQDKLSGLAHPVVPIVNGPGNQVLPEDYITSLAEDAQGHLWVGYRSKGYEAFRTDGSRIIPYIKDMVASDYVGAILPLSSGLILIGKYAGGLNVIQATFEPKTEIRSITQGRQSMPKQGSVGLVALPSPAKPLAYPYLEAMSSQSTPKKLSSTALQVAYLGDDWETQGDWVGRYGDQKAVLWATKAPWNDVFGAIDDPSNSNGSRYEITAQIGPYHSSDDAIRHFVSAYHTDNRKVLYNPTLGYRREATIDDHSEAYPMTVSGNDLWFTVDIPRGLHRVSLYFYNKDGHDGDNRFRDYLIEWKAFVKTKHEDGEERKGLSPPRTTGALADLDVALTEPTLAKARVRSFWGGVYKQFDAFGPNKFLIHVSKNGSLNTICSAIFVDNLSSAQLMPKPLFVANPVSYSPPNAVVLQNGEPIKQNARISKVLKFGSYLWDSSSSNSLSQNVIFPQRLKRIQAYRAVANDDLAYLNSYPQPAPAERTDASQLLDNWRWHLQLWQDRDRDNFDRKMKDFNSLKSQLISQGQDNERQLEALEASRK